MRVSADYLVQCTAATFLPVDRDEFRNPGVKEMAQNESVNQIAYYIYNKKITALAGHQAKRAQNIA